MSNQAATQGSTAFNDLTEADCPRRQILNWLTSDRLFDRDAPVSTPDAGRDANSAPAFAVSTLKIKSNPV
jgi:hypothetical protein